jgi:predicted acetylornithine/succinylornithine family transaminase
MEEKHQIPFEKIKETEESYQLNTYNKLPLSIERGEGVYVYDSDGKKYLDLYGGHAVALTGHCHPEVVKAVREQADKLLFYSNVVYSSVRADASEALINTAPRGMGKVFFCNSGSEANETAMKIGRRYSGRKKIIAMKNGFHGRTIGSLSATALGSYRKQFSPIIEDYVFVEFGNIEEFEQSLTEETGTVILEPVQSMGGVELAEDSYYKKLREICSDRGLVLIFDEIQTGLGRTGAWFFGDRIGMSPDIITLAKGLGGGIPVGAVIINDRISETIGPGEHGSTFGGGPVAMAAVKANIDVIKSEELVQNAREAGEYIRQELSRMENVKSVKGIGLLLGVEIGSDAASLRNFLLDRGIITGTSSKKNILRLLPPLILKHTEIDIFLSALREYR